MKVLDLQRDLSHRILQGNRPDARSVGKTEHIRQPNGQKVPRQPLKPGESFSDVFQKTVQQQEELRFSAHAAKRLEDRNIQLSGAQMQRLNDGVQKIGEKGGRNSLIMIDDNAYVVSIENKTVVTTMAKDISTGNVFTNIDSVLIN